MLESYDLNIVRKNIFHELNKMLITFPEEYVPKTNLPINNIKSINQNDMVKYYLRFSLKLREKMASFLNVSEKTLYRLYEEPLRLLNDFEATIKLACYFSYSYPHLIGIFFNESIKNNFSNTNDSTLLRELHQFEQSLSVEERRDVARVLHMVLKLGIKTSDFVELNFKIINKRIFDNLNLKRIYNFIDNI